MLDKLKKLLKDIGGIAITKVLNIYSFGIINKAYTYYNYKRQIHREDGPAICTNYGLSEWYINGQRHREDGPALVFDMFHDITVYSPDFVAETYWFTYDKLHRLDGPAYTDMFGETQYYVDGIQYHSYFEYIVAVEQYKAAHT